MTFRVSADGQVFVSHGSNSKEEAIGHIGRLTDPLLYEWKTNAAKAFRVQFSYTDPENSPDSKQSRPETKEKRVQKKSLGGRG